MGQADAADGSVFLGAKCLDHDPGPLRPPIGDFQSPGLAVLAALANEACPFGAWRSCEVGGARTEPVKYLLFGGRVVWVFSAAMHEDSSGQSGSGASCASLTVRNWLRLSG